MESDVQATTVICENKIEDRAQIGSDGEIKPENMDTENPSMVSQSISEQPHSLQN